jgi:hypothetical protein
VYLGAFRTDQLRRAGGWRTDLPVNEDFDLNRRMSQHGLVWFDASLLVDYVARDSLGALLHQYVEFGRSKVRYWERTGDRPQPRQVALLALPVLAAAVTVAGLAVAPMRARGGAALAVVGLASAIEVFGSDSPRGSFTRHLAGLAATTCVAAGWLTGVWSEMAVATVHRQACRPA